jgi:IclR family pca regulon transcriptional regulator
MRTLAHLASGLGLSRSAAYRLVYTLEKSGFIERDSATRRYRVTSKVLMLALVKLGASIPASVYLVIRDGWQSVYIARVAPSVGLVSNLQVGSRQPAHLTASGRVLLADLAEERLSIFYARLKRDGDSVARRMSLDQLKRQTAEDRSTGYVYHKSVLEPGLSSCAMPIRDGSGRAVAAITVVGMDNAVKAFGGEKSLAASPPRRNGGSVDAAWIRPLKKSRPSETGEPRVGRILLVRTPFRQGAARTTSASHANNRCRRTTELKRYCTELFRHWMDG